MKSLIAILTATIIMVSTLFVSCSKDDDNSGLSTGKMSVTKDGKTESYIVTATKNDKTEGGISFTAMTVTGVNTSLSNPTQASTMTVAVFATKIEKKTYKVPSYSLSSGSIYDPAAGYAVGGFSAYENSALALYSTQFIENTSGSVTITSITESAVKGTYEFKLGTTADKSKFLTIKGEFNGSFLGLPF